MNLFPVPMGANHVMRVLIAVCSLLSVGRTQAQPVIVSTVPFNGATGVPTSTSLVVTFSEAMNTTLSLPYLVDGTTYQILPASASWSAGDTVLTCSPTAALPPDRLILWTVMNAQNRSGTPLMGTSGGVFTTAPANVPLTLTNAAWSPGAFSFDVLSPAGQTLTVEYSSTMRSNQWFTLLTTNSPSGRVRIADPQSSTNPRLFYRARTGS
jgi:hypothetical protein